MNEQRTLQDFIPPLKGWWNVNEFEGNVTIEGQFRKMIEEIQELFEGLKKKDEKEIKDALGDIQVVCIMGCFILGNEVKRSGLKLLHFDSIELGVATAIEAFLSVPLFSLHTIRRVAVELGYDPNECLSLAWEEIKDRRGHWENGVFVKHVKPEVLHMTEAPEIGTKYWLITAYGEPLDWDWCNGSADNKILKRGDAFETEELRDRALALRKEGAQDG